MTPKEAQKKRDILMYESGREQGKKEEEAQQSYQDKSPTGTPYSKKWVEKQ